jgi:hypothetical protein
LILPIVNNVNKRIGVKYVDDDKNVDCTHEVLKAADNNDNNDI